MNQLFEIFCNLMHLSWCALVSPWWLEVDLNFNHIVIFKCRFQAPNDVTRALILALGVCYHAGLHNRLEYRECVARKFRDPCSFQGGHVTMLNEITWYVLSTHILNIQQYWMRCIHIHVVISRTWNHNDSKAIMFIFTCMRAAVRGLLVKIKIY